jgi:hypothetical protein
MMGAAILGTLRTPGGNIDNDTSFTVDILEQHVIC